MSDREFEDVAARLRAVEVAIWKIEGLLAEQRATIGLIRWGIPVLISLAAIAIAVAQS